VSHQHRSCERSIHAYIQVRPRLTQMKLEACDGLQMVRALPCYSPDKGSHTLLDDFRRKRHNSRPSSSHLVDSRLSVS